MHAGKTSEHASQALQAVKISGLRAVFAYAFPWFRFQKWNQTECTPMDDIMPEWVFGQIETWLKEQVFTGSRVHIGFGFDFYFLPKEVLQRIFSRVRKAGVKLITSHVVDSVEIGMQSPVKKMKEAELLGPDIVLSHCNRLDSTDLKTLSAHGIYVSSTPETEAQMGLGWPMALEPHVNGSIGVDTHACGPSTVLGQARSLLLLSRQQKNIQCLEQSKFPRTLRGNTEKVFNLATIEGARAVGMGDRMGKIAKGYLADLVIFNTTSPSMLCAYQFDPLVAVLRHSDVRDVDTVIIDGKVRKQSGKLLPIQLEDGKKISYDEIGEILAQSQQDISKRIDKVNLEKGRELLLGLLHITDDNFQSAD
ncbi:hypothetical protein N0V90_009499 [Kalmusia sp. IMI 367209]|nr:hypothetical protein N0V90_009499 [Kalmusia sp. IMI 367209]